MVEEAIKKGFVRYGLSEHMPRYSQNHLYAEEVCSMTGPQLTLQHGLSISDLETQFDRFVSEAKRLQEVFAGRIELFVGMETEYCDEDYLAKSLALAKHYQLDYIVGSVHHVLGIPIDFSLELYKVAVTAVGSTEALFLAYFDMMEKMINGIRPTVIGHFDLIRMFCPQQEMTPAIMEAAHKAVRAGVANQCLFEVNSSAIRKGLPTPYPQRDILQVIILMSLF